MNPTLISKIAVRILALYLIAMGITNVGGQLAFFLSTGGIESSENNLKNVSIIFAAIPIIVGIASFLLSNSVAKLVAGKDYPDNSKELTTLGLQSILFATLGVYFIISTLPILAQQLFAYFQTTSVMNEQVYRQASLLPPIVASAIEIFLGLVLVLGSRFFSKLLYNFKEFGLDKKL